MAYCRKPLTQPMFFLFFFVRQLAVVFHPACQPWLKDKCRTVVTAFVWLKVIIFMLIFSHKVLVFLT